MSKFTLSLLLGLCLVLSSCGDLSNKEKYKAQITQFSVCKMDVDKLSKIFSVRISDQLQCLGENLTLFIKMVKSDKPGYLSLKELKGYVNVHFKNDIDPEFMVMIDQVFNMSAIMFGEDPEYISKNSVDKLINLADFFNEQMVASNFYDYFKEDKKKLSLSEHNRRKAKVFAAMTKVGSRFSEVINLRNNSVVINIREFLRSFHNDENRKKLLDTEKLLFVKKIFLGGHENFITALEVKKLGSMMGDLSKIAFDLLKFHKVLNIEDQQEEVINTLKVDFQSLLSHLAFDRFSQERLFTIYNVFDAIEFTAPELLKYTKYKDQMLKVKEIFLESSSAAFSPNELYILINDIILENLKRGSFFYRAFSLNKKHLEQPIPLSVGIKNSFYMNKEEKKFKDDFNHITKDYKYFKGGNLTPIYTHDYSRSPYGMFEVALFEDLFKRLMSFYGDKISTAKGGYRLTLDQIIRMVYDFKEIFVGEGILKEGYLEDSSNTIALLSTLFQAHSDGDGDIELDEMVEFVINIYSAFELSDIMTKRLKSVCKLDEKGKFSPVCWRQHFKSMMHLRDDKKKKVLDYLPRLNDFLTATDYAGRIKFLKKTENFTRTCTVFDDGSDVPMQQSDLFKIFGGMIALEQTLLKYDFNRSNTLEPSEVDKSYVNYALAVKAIIPVDFLKSWSKDFYLYLMKYEKVPEVEDVGFFQAFGSGMQFVWYKAFRNKKTGASRYTLTSVLKVISEKMAVKPFPCETLR